MGMQVTAREGRSPVELMAAIRRAELAAAEPILAAAVEGAPYEPKPRHGIHLNETGYVKFVAAGTDAVQVGFTAFWAAWQHEHMDWHHNHGHAKFLELAVAEGAQQWRQRIAEAIRAALA